MSQSGLLGDGPCRKEPMVANGVLPPSGLGFAREMVESED